jgi:4-oxalocrotonate tautomerase
LRQEPSNTFGYNPTPLKWPLSKGGKALEKQISRRNFLKKGALALGTVAACDFERIGSAGQLSGSTTFVSEELKEKTMPHVIVKLYPGRSEQQKMRLAEQIVKDVVSIIKCGEESVSVAIEEIKAEDWAEKVYKPDILNTPGKLYKKPGYSM